MVHLRTLLGASLLVGVLAAEATATTLTTTFVYVPPAGSISCDVVNVSKKPKRVTIRIIRLDGTTFLSVSHTLAPGAGNGVSDGVAGNYFGRCEFKYKGGRRAVRAATVLYESNTAPAPSVALPAE